MLRRACLCALALLILQGRVAAKAPVLERLFPAGACRGSEGELTATGTFEHSPERCWVSGEGVLIEATPEKGRLRFKVESNAAPGLRWVRLHDDEGASALSPFIVGTLPELLEVEPNDDPRQPQTLEYACATVNGRLEKAGDVDGYAVWLERGQTLVASMEAHRHLGSPMDAVLQVVSEAGFVLAQNDDDVEFDPQLVFVAPADGSYIVRTFAFPATPNSTIAFAGGSAFVYRLTLTTGGFVDHVLPLALERSKPGPVELFGWNLPEQARRVELCPDPLAAMTVVSHPLVANTAEIRWFEHASIREQEPNGPDQPQAITLPLAVSGLIDPPGDQDVFPFPAKKGQPVALRVEARSLGSPLDPVLCVLDSAGATVAENDDAGRDRRDAELTFRPPADGTFRVVVQDLNHQGGFRFAYLLTAAEPLPDFRLSVKADVVTLRPDKPAELAVAIDRKDGFDAPVTIRAEGLPEGVQAEPVTSEPKGNTAKAVTLLLKADRALLSGAFRIVGETQGEKPLRRVAVFTIPSQNTAVLDLWVTVVAPEAKESKK